MSKKFRSESRKRSWERNDLRKRRALGRHHAGAQQSLIRALAFEYLYLMQNGKCWRCKEDLGKGAWHLDHKIAWLNSDDPKKNFYDIRNLAASHPECNMSHSAKQKLSS